MKKIAIIGVALALAAGVSACGKNPATRMATGAAVGAGAAALGAWAYDEDPGKAAIIGAGLGAGAGLLTPPGTFDGGYPYWN